MRNIYTLILIISLSTASTTAQKVDSLWGIWNDNALSVSVRIKALTSLSNWLNVNNPVRAIFLADSILIAARGGNNQILEAHALRLKGDYFHYQYAYDSAQEYYFSSLWIFEEIQYMHETALVNDRISNNYLRQHNYLKALELSKKSLDINIVLSDSIGIATSYKNIGVDHYYLGDFINSLKCFQIARDLYMKLEQKEETADMASRLGAIYYHQGHYTLAIIYMNEYLEYYKESKNLNTQAEIYTNLGAVYFQLNDFTRAQEYYEKGLAIDKQFGQHRGRAIGNYNIGECYLVQEEFQTALEYFQKSLEISQEFNEKDIVADCYLALGMIKKNKKEYSEAFEYYQKSLEAAEEIGYNAILSSIYTSKGDLYNELSDHRKAMENCQLSLKSSQATGDIQKQIDACNCLYVTYKALKDPAMALEYHETFLALTDSLHEEETIRQLQKMEFDRQMLEDSLKVEEEKLLAEMASQKEISKERTRKNIFLFSGIGIFIMSIGLYSRLSYIRKSRSIIQKEKERSENLLLNILPGEVAEELKIKGESVARDFNDVTVLFTDFKGFTSISENLNAQELVAEINTCFKAFDQIITSYGIEKIKTIGDAYLAAGGLHSPRTSSVVDVVMAGLEMQSFMESRKIELRSMNQPFFEMRTGIHTGQVVAGIVGVKKFQYDIWGDTVNIANRMESSGKVGKVNISETTYNQIKDDPNFVFDPRGKVIAKNKGSLEMYFVSLKD